MISQYDRHIESAKEILSSLNMKSMAFAQSWPVCPQDELILRGDMAMELGSNGGCALSGIFFTTDEKLVPEKLISVKGTCLESKVSVGPDDAVDYLRFVFIRLKKELVENRTPQQLYAIFRKLDYIRYHVFPEGFSPRISTQQHKEVVRVSKKAVEKRISLESVAQTFIDAYSVMPEVECVQVYLVAQKKDAGLAECFGKLKELAIGGEKITESLNVIFQGLEMDCSTCAQKSICDEIDGMKELHQSLL